jgi:transglutaminase-like putative cysteine protease
MKMKKRLLIPMLIVLLALLASPATAVWYLTADSVTVDLVVKSSLDLERKTGASLDYLTANVSFVPKESAAQSVLSVDADPKPEAKDGTYLFRWDDPVPSSPQFEIRSRVKTKNTFHDIRKINFPYIGFPDDVAQYLEPTETIDAGNEKIIAKASELATGETDYYSVVFKMADWTKENVEYDLSTLNRKASNKASWVLARKDGVCDEITTLFIALLRAVGIPAKFVAGVAYTESPKFPENWGAHGWAEVYFPGTGWVPFDVTYGEYGYADPTHIKMKEAFDSAESDTKYEWLGRNVQVYANPITVSADLVKKEGLVPDSISISVDMLQESVDIGSYNLVEATLTNKVDSYISTLLFLAKVNELEVEGNSYQAIMLKPKETKKFYWLVKVIDTLDSHYTYTFPMTVANLRNTSADTEFYVIPGATVFSREDMEQVVDAAKKEEEKKFSKKIDIECIQKAEYYYIYDNPEIECYATNTGNFPFKELEFCFEDECIKSDLAITQKKAFPYTLHYPEPGINKIQFTVEGKDVSKTFFFDLDVLDEPKISIDDIEYPSQIEFKQPYVVSFTLEKASASTPEEVIVDFDAAGLLKKLEFNSIPVDKKLIFNLNSEDLSTKPNMYTIAVTYEDRNGKTYTQKEEFEVSLVNVTFGQRMVIFLYDIDRWIRNLFK